MGDSACWLDVTCPECTAMLDASATEDAGAAAVVCGRCGATITMTDTGPERLDLGMAIRGSVTAPEPEGDNGSATA